MKKIRLYLSSCEFPSTAIAWVCLAVAKTHFELAWQCGNPGNATGADLNRSPLGLSFVNRASSPAALHPVTIPIAKVSQLLRGLVQPRFIPLAFLRRFQLT